MYYAHFGLIEAPFSISPNPAYLFMTERHQEALAHLYHGIESDAGFVLLTGDVGTGKTTVCRRFLHHLPENTQVAFILNPCVERIELLQAICKELKISAVENDNQTANESQVKSTSLRQVTDCLHEYLLANHAKGVNTVLLIDEAQQMHPSVLEFIRLLTNLETDKQKLLKIILVGQPELNAILAQPTMTQLSQRITARYHIYPLTFEELSDYISHRLSVAGYTKKIALFSSRRIKQLFSMTKGVPRLVNVICDRALLGAYSQNSYTVNKKTLINAHQEVIGNYTGVYAEPSLAHVRAKLNRPFVAPVMFLLSMACVMVVGMYMANIPSGRVNVFLNNIHSSIFNSQWIKNNVHNASEREVNDIDDLAVVAHNNARDTVIPVLPSLGDSKIGNKKISMVDTGEEELPVNHSSLGSLQLQSEEILSDKVIADEVVDSAVESKKERPAVKYFNDKESALSVLLAHGVAQLLPDKRVGELECDRLRLVNSRCESVNESRWQSLKKYNRPAVISLKHNDLQSYIVVVGVTDTDIVVVSSESSVQRKNVEPMYAYLPIHQLQSQWQKELTFIWQAPLGFERYIFKKSNASLIDWLANAFSIIDQQNNTLAKGKYNSLLEQRIRLFQKDHKLKEDGKAGIETLLKLNESLGLAITLNNNEFIKKIDVGQ